MYFWTVFVRCIYQKQLLSMKVCQISRCIQQWQKVYTTMKAIEYYSHRQRQTHTHTRIYTHKNPAKMSNYINYLRTPQRSPSFFCFVNPFGWFICRGGYLRRGWCVDIKNIVGLFYKNWKYSVKHLRWRLFQE